MLKFIYSLNEINSWIIFLIGTIGSLWSIIELVKKKELKKSLSTENCKPCGNF